MYRIFDGIEDVTYSPEDWEDFWYNSATNSMTIHSTKDRNPLMNCMKNTVQCPSQNS